MNRTTFLTLYIIIALLFSGGLSSSWTVTIMALTLGQQGLFALLSPVFIISIFSPIALIVLAHLRGKRVGNRKLIWFPIAALGLTLLPLLFGVFTKLFSGNGSERSLESISLYATMFMATASTLGPLILHTICCVMGGKRDQISDTPSTVSTTEKGGMSNKFKIVIVMALFLLIAGYYYLNRAQEVHWIDEVALHDGKIFDVHRTTTFTYGKGGDLSEAKKTPNYYSLRFSHPVTGKQIKWKGEYGFEPIMLDFVDVVPYLVILQADVFANLKQYGCPDIPYVFFRYDTNKMHWEQISSSSFPTILINANLKDGFFGNEDVSEGMRLSKERIVINNLDMEGRTNGYFVSKIPKDFDSWDYEHKYEARNRHFKDGCRPEKLMPVPNSARRVSLNISDNINYDPEWVYKSADDIGTPWHPMVLDKDRSEMCKTLLRPEVPGVQGTNYFIGDTTGLKKLLISGHVICDIDAVWAFDYAIENKRVVIAKYKVNGDLDFRVSFPKPDDINGYQGSVMYPSFKFVDGHLTFEWWNFNRVDQDVHVKRSMTLKVRELLSVSPTTSVPVKLQGDVLPLTPTSSTQKSPIRPPYLAKGSPVHVISIYAAGVVNLTVSEPDAALLLFAYEPVEWRISVAKGITIKRVIAIGTHDQRITFSGGEKPQEVVARSRDILEQAGINLRNDFPFSYEANDLIDIANISLALTGTLPRSYQGTYKGFTNSFTISPQTSLFKLPIPRGPVSGGISTTLQSNFKEAVNGNSLQRGPAGAYTDAWSDRIYSAGKVYFEGKMRVTGALAAHSHTNIGLCLVRGKAIESPMQGGVTAIQNVEQKLYKDGDVFGIAADFDQQRVYFHVNGRWLNGAPDSASGSLLEKGKEYRACVFATGSTSSELKRGGMRSDTTWEVNFGDRPFFNPIPNSYNLF